VRDLTVAPRSSCGPRPRCALRVLKSRREVYYYASAANRRRDIQRAKWLTARNAPACTTQPTAANLVRLRNNDAGQHGTSGKPPAGIIMWTEGRRAGSARSRGGEPGISFQTYRARAVDDTERVLRTMRLERRTGQDPAGARPAEHVSRALGQQGGLDRPGAGIAEPAVARLLDGAVPWPETPVWSHSSTRCCRKSGHRPPRAAVARQDVSPRRCGGSHHAMPALMGTTRWKAAVRHHGGWRRQVESAYFGPWPAAARIACMISNANYGLGQAHIIQGQSLTCGSKR